MLQTYTVQNGRVQQKTVYVLQKDVEYELCFNDKQDYVFQNWVWPGETEFCMNFSAPQTALTTAKSVMIAQMSNQ